MGTRGAAMSAAYFAAGERTMTWLGVGNVEGRFVSGSGVAPAATASLPLLAGVLGHDLPQLMSQTLGLEWVTVVLATDGVAASYADTRLPAGSPGEVAEQVITTHTWGGRRARAGRALSRRGPMTVQAPAFRGLQPRVRGVSRAGSETALRAAYELGREAVVQELTLLELGLTHHEVLLETLVGAPDDRDAEAVIHAAADFQMEALSAYEVIRRGFAETVDAIAIERRQAAMFRRLSEILSDTSLASRSRSSLTEVLQLVVEQARELTDAECSVARAARLDRTAADGGVERHQHRPRRSARG